MDRARLSSAGFSPTTRLMQNVQMGLRQYRIAFSDTPVANKNANSHWVWQDGTEPVRLTTEALPESVRFSKDYLICLKASELKQDDMALVTKEEPMNPAKYQQVQQQEEQNFLAPEVMQKAFSEMKVNDLIVHRDHGVGVFKGLTVMQIGGIQNEFIELCYAGGDKLYLPIYRLSLLHRHMAGSFTLDTLGGKSWEKAKVRVRSHLRDRAHELLILYARRSQATTPPLPKPDVDFARFSQACGFEETPDQMQAIEAVIKDMCDSRPMDRLLCGDVGFGKTEVALRAAYLATQGGQVVVLVPTTILCLQHLNTFQKRFEGWPVCVKALSRFTTSAEVAETLSGLQAGKVDIVIGTHRLLSQDIRLKNLRLLIIDEEQRFGVAQKEKIRQLRANVDTLALSATPLPRTLNMGLMGLRDLSLIQTPPKNRLPIRTFLSSFDAHTVRRAVLAEIQRGGQVFYIFNRIQGLERELEQLQRLIPEARMLMAHGQMSKEDLRKGMVDFFHQKYDMLVTTTIVESGLDIPQVNTLLFAVQTVWG